MSGEFALRCCEGGLWIRWWLMFVCVRFRLIKEGGFVKSVAVVGYDRCLTETTPTASGRKGR